MVAQFFIDGGFTMVFTTFFGVSLVLCSVVLARHLSSQVFAAVLSLATTTLGSGTLGVCLGLVMTFRHLTQFPIDKQFEIAALGTAESLNNIILAAFFITISAFICAIAAFRARGLSGAIHVHTCN